MAILTIQPDAAAGQDTYIRSAAYAGANFGVAGLLIGHVNADSVVRTLIKFDLSSLPSAATLSSVTLSLYATADLSGNARTFRVCRQKRAWVEGTQNNVANTTGADWSLFSIGNNWQTAGGFGANDCEQTDIGSRAFTATETLNVFKDFVLTPTTKADLDLGNGWLIKTDTETNDAYGFASSDDATGANRPKLVIVYKVISLIAGTSSGTGTASGTLKGKGRVDGAAVGVAADTSSLFAIGTLAGAISAVATVVGDIRAAEPIIGVAAGLSSATGVLSASGTLAGAIAGTSSADGTLAAIGTLVGSSAGTATDSATITSSLRLHGDSAGAATESALLLAIGYLRGSSEGIGTAVGRFAGDSSLVGSALAIATESAILTARGYAEGNVSGSATVVAVIMAFGTLAGSSTGVGSATGDLDSGLAVSLFTEEVFIRMYIGHFKAMR